MSDAVPRTGTATPDQPVFAWGIDALEPLVAAESGFSLRHVITEPSALVGVDKIQPTLFAVQVALAELWRSWGVVPAAVIGHSMGEVAAAVVCGALTAAEGAAVICRRSALLAQATGGAMASVLLPVGQVEDDLAAAGARSVSVAVVSAPAATVVSGDPEEIAILVGQWQSRDIAASMVDVDVASHSGYMDPLLGPLREALADLRPTAPTLRFYSTVTPEEGRSLDADYWADNLRQVVRFSSACTRALGDGHRLFIECTPHPLALRALGENAAGLGAADIIAVGSLRRDTPDREAFMAGLGAVHCAGGVLDWQRHYGDGDLAELPGTSWNRRVHRIDPPYRLIAPHLIGADQHCLLGGHVHDQEDPECDRYLWQTPISAARVPWLADHQVSGVPVMAGAGLCEMALAAGAQIFATDHVQATEIALQAPLVLGPEQTVTTSAVRHGDAAKLRIFTPTPDGPLVHATAVLAPGPSAHRRGPAHAPASDWTEVVPADVYAYLRSRHDIAHGPAFTGIERIQLHPRADTAVASVRITDPARSSSWMTVLHPALLDEVVQAVAAVWSTRYVLDPGPVVVSGFAAVRVFGPAGHARRACVSLNSADSGQCTASATLMTADGKVVAEIEGLALSNITPPDQRFNSRLSHLEWAAMPPCADAALTGDWLVIAEHDGPWEQELAAALQRRGAASHPLTKAPDYAQWDGKPLNTVVVISAEPTTPPAVPGQSPHHARL
ncbi:acyltransferase domain-containing protein [Streptomyces spectabilis]|uniref:Acyl transferase domain-containing protein n=1 Tax=Streptomyces spectabilis TaxID=68270 RepID=A0A7W8B605_STRST|nr:acyltransferase domain-containing protein [Streptomyces spectabilis]MBB5109820.1 acyl transferase domain-containing protein [Streptomyces spectabilis]GGV57938.1 hypothetical protein GCM10010245_91070 [Streptomyces spectabilis]